MLRIVTVLGLGVWLASGTITGVPTGINDQDGRPSGVSWPDETESSMRGGGSPPNDECFNAISVADGVPIGGSNVGATASGGTGGCEFGPPVDVWYYYTPTVSEAVNVSLCGGADFDTVLSVHDACDAPDFLGCDDDGCESLQSQLSLPMTAGITYMIRVDGYGGQTGPFTLTVSGVGPGVYYSENFESGLGGFTIDNTYGDGSGLWHFTTECESPTGDHTTPGSLYYGVDPQCNFDAGWTEGVVTSPVIDLTGVSSPIWLSFQYFLETEELVEAYDWASVEVSENGGPFMTVAHNDPALGVVTIADPSLIWQSASIDLSARAGSYIEIRFRFRTGDSALNQFEGFYVDDVVVSASGTSCEGEPPPVPGGPEPEDEAIDVPLSADLAWGVAGGAGTPVYGAGQEVLSSQRDSTDPLAVSSIIRRGDPQGEYTEDAHGSAIVTSTSFAPRPQRGAGLIQNGDFETGDLSGWSLANDTGDGTWTINDGSFSPYSGDGPLPPCNGWFSAISDQYSDDIYTLYQEVTLPVGATTATLYWTDMIRNHYFDFVDPEQEFRVEIWDLGGTPLATLFSTNPGDQLFTDCTTRSADISMFIGTTFLVAFTEQIWADFFNVHLDDVRIEVDGELEPCAVLYAAATGVPGGNAPSSLYTINPATGAATLIGAIGFDGVTGLSFAPDGTLYGTCIDPGVGDALLITIDPATGAGTPVGRVDTAGGGTWRVPDISFRGSGVLYGYGEQGDVLITIDTSTGQGTLVGPTGFYGGGNGLDFAPGGTLYATPDDYSCLVILDPATGAGACDPGSVGLVAYRVNALEFCRNSGVLYGSWNDNANSGLYYLVTIDPATGDTTTIGETVLGLDAITFAPGGASTCALTYDVHVGTDPGALQLTCANVDDPTCDPGLLECGTTYYWQVTAKNSQGQAQGAVWSFTTRDCDCDYGACCLDDNMDGIYEACAVDTASACAQGGGVFRGICSECPEQNTFIFPESGGDVFVHMIGPPVDCMGGTRAGRSSCPGGGPYIDPWRSRADAQMCQNFGVTGSPPIPADFFGPGSDPFDGFVCLEGVPLGATQWGDFGEADTLISRSDDPFDRCDLPSGSLREVDVEVVALSLVDVDPITVTYYGGQSPDEWNVAVDLSEIAAPVGTLTATKTHCNGGTYTSVLHVLPRFTFTKVGDPGVSWVLDTGLEGIAPTTLDQQVPEAWASDIDQNLGLTGDLCSDFHAGIEDVVQETDCDCNGNDVRDKCDIEGPASADCNTNALPDECDIAGGTSSDGNTNGVPDECEPSTLRRPELPGNSQHRARKHRYLSIDATTNLPGEMSIKVEIAEMNRCQNDLRRSCIDDEDCPTVCAAAPDIHSCGNGSICPDGVCIESGPCGPHPDVGMSWYVQNPQTRGADCPNGMCDEEDYYARVDAVVYGSDWKDECEDARIPGWTGGCATLHIGDCEIVPGVRYNVYACDPVTGTLCSDPLQVETTRRPQGASHYGDTAGGVTPELVFEPPDDYTNVKDVSAYLLTLGNWGTATLPQAHPTWIDLHGPGAGIPPQYILMITDLTMILRAWVNVWPYENTIGGLAPGECP